MPIDANKVAEEAYSAGNLVTNDGYYEFDLEAAATVIQSAFAEELAERDATILSLREQLEKACAALAYVKAEASSAVSTDGKEVDPYALGRCRTEADRTLQQIKDTPA